MGTKLSPNSMNTMEEPPGIPPPPADAPARVDKTGVELKRGALLNTIALLASNFRGIFTFLVARLLGPAVLGLFSVAWATTDLISKIGIVGLDNAITTFIARSEAVGDRARSRMLFRLAVGLAVAQSAVVAALAIVVIRLFGHRFGLQADMVSAHAIVLCALPGIALYRMSTSVSRGMKIMQHDIYSRGITEPIATTLAFLITFIIGFRKFGPELAAIVGTATSGAVALGFASKLFRRAPAKDGSTSFQTETRQLLAYATPIGAYQLLNTLISRLDIILLGCFIGRAPGVTLTAVGIYGAAVDTANGLRKLNQTFNPIFAPVVAGMTAKGDRQRAQATYERLAQWMLWILLPLVMVMMLAGSLILLIYGPAFQIGAEWLGIVAVAAAINAFVSLGETVIMVQRPGLNLLNSSIACAISCLLLLWLIPRFGVMGAAVSTLAPQVVQGILRSFALRVVFGWKTSWRNIRPPMTITTIALIPALLCRSTLGGIIGQITAAGVFLAVFGSGWWYYNRLRKRT
jgi:O-antigen/teichoic acid export membrane protein